MESNQSPEETLAAAERAALAPWIEQPATPWWYIPSFGLLMGAVVLILGEQASMPSALYVVSAIVVAALIGAWLGAIVAHQGVVPRMRSAPPEFVPVVRGYFVGYAVALALVVSLYVTIGSRVAAAAAAVLTWGGLFAYEKRYEAAAESVRDRMA